MAITYVELTPSRTIEVTKDGAQITLLIEFNSDDPVAIELNLPPEFHIGAAYPNPVVPLTVSSRSMAPVGDNSHSRMNVVYSANKEDREQDIYGEIWRWAIGSEQVHIKSVNESSDITHYPPTKNTGQGIGVDGDETHGADVYRATGRIEVIIRVRENSLASKKNTIENLRSTVNSGVWKGYPSRSVLFQGADIEREQVDPSGNAALNIWRVSYSFIVSPSSGVNTFTVDLWNGSSLYPITVEANPWDRVDYTFVNVKDGNAKRQYIDSVHVSRVQRPENFGQFNFLGGNF